MIACSKPIRRIPLLGRLHREDPRALEPSGPLHDLHLASLGEAREPPGKAPDDPVLPRVELRRVDRGGPEVHPALPELRRRGHRLRGAEERLGGNAAHVEAYSAEGRVPLDEHGAPAEVGGPEGGGVAARSRPDNYHLRAEVDVVRDRGRGVAGLDPRSGVRCRRRRRRRRGLGGRSGRFRCRLSRGGSGHHPRIRGLTRRAFRLRLRSDWRRFLRGGIGGLGTRTRIEPHQHGSRRDAVPDRDLDGGDHAFGRRREVHARLVALEDDHRIVEPDPVSRRDEDLDDLHLGRLAEVRYDDPGRFHGSIPSSSQQQAPDVGEYQT